MRRISGMAGYLALAVLPLAVHSARAAEGPAFTLGKAVPAGVYVYIHTAHNPEQDFLRQYWGEVFKAFNESGVVEDVHTLIGSSMGESERPDFEKLWTRAGELIHGVDWEARVDEFVFAGRMAAPVPEYVVLIRYEDGKAEKNAEAFSAVLKEVAATVNDESQATYTTATSHGARVGTLAFPKAPFLNLRVAVRESVVALALDRTLLDEALAALAGEGNARALIETDRYKQALAKLPPPEDAVSFVDFKELFQGVRGMFEFALSQKPEDPHAKEALSVLGKIIDEFSMFDYVAETTSTQGYQQISETVVSLSPDAEKSRLYKVFKPEPLEKFDRFIPKEATGYSVFSGFDLSALYAGVIDFIDKETPGGKELLKQWDEVQENINFRFDRDLFNWLDGQFISVTLPAAAAGPFSDSDWVWFVKVRDEKKAAEIIKRGLDAAVNELRQPIASQPAGVEGAEGFRMVTHPFLAMLSIHPVYGFANGYLIIGSSSKAIEACLATSRGERPSVNQNERVKREGVILQGAVSSASFQDLSTLGKDIARVLSGLGVVSVMIPDQAELKPVKGIIGILGKLSPVAMKLDFFQSTSSASTFDGKAWHSKSVVTYRQPPAK